ncbi:MAG TPA: response regulator [Bryobacteraceae bacterium]|nr:response regulator [Bryobacteraceae bacterium]
MSFAVMIVDDSPAMRAFVRRILDMSGLEISRCLEAGDGSEALRLVRQNPVNVILSDINMPVMDGEELVRELNADPELRHIPVVVVSTDRTETRVQKMLALGARGYVTKPFLPEALRQELERVLEVVHDRD